MRSEILVQSGVFFRMASPQEAVIGTTYSEDIDETKAVDVLESEAPEGSRPRERHAIRSIRPHAPHRHQTEARPYTRRDLVQSTVTTGGDRAYLLKSKETLGFLPHSQRVISAHTIKPVVSHRT